MQHMIHRPNTFESSWAALNNVVFVTSENCNTTTLAPYFLIHFPNPVVHFSLTMDDWIINFDEIFIVIAQKLYKKSWTCISLYKPQTHIGQITIGWLVVLYRLKYSLWPTPPMSSLCLPRQKVIPLQAWKNLI